MDYPLRGLAFGKQFKAAAESGARFAVIYGQDELARGCAKVRDLQNREEHEVPLAELVESLLTALRP